MRIWCHDFFEDETSQGAKAGDDSIGLACDRASSRGSGHFVFVTPKKDSGHDQPALNPLAADS